MSAASSLQPSRVPAPSRAREKAGLGSANQGPAPPTATSSARDWSGEGHASQSEHECRRGPPERCRNKEPGFLAGGDPESWGCRRHVAPEEDRAWSWALTTVCTLTHACALLPPAPDQGVQKSTPPDSAPAVSGPPHSCRRNREHWSLSPVLCVQSRRPL